MFGGQPIVDGDDRHVEHPRHLGAEARMRLDIADHEAATVVEDQHRPRLTRVARVEQPRGNGAAGSGDRQIADHRQFAHRQIGDILHRREHLPRRLGRHLVRARPRHRVQIVQESAHVRPDVGSGVGGSRVGGRFGHSALSGGHRLGRRSIAPT